MIEVEKIYDDIRTEGLYCGTPMTFVKLGLGTEYPSCRQLLENVVLLGRRRWVCLIGENTTRAGIGRFFEGLKSFGFSSEVVITGNRKEPGWRNKTTSIIVELGEELRYDLTTLRMGDAIRISLHTVDDVKNIQSVLDRFEEDPFWKFLFIDPVLGKGEKRNLVLKRMIMEAAEAANKCEKARVFWNV